MPKFKVIITAVVVLVVCAGTLWYLKPLWWYSECDSADCMRVLPAVENSGGIEIRTDKPTYLINEPIFVSIQNNTNEGIFVIPNCGAPFETLLRWENDAWQPYTANVTKDCFANPALEVAAHQVIGRLVRIEDVYGSKAVEFKWDLRPQRYKFVMKYTVGDPNAPVHERDFIIADHYSNEFTIGRSMFEAVKADTSALICAQEKQAVDQMLDAGNYCQTDADCVTMIGSDTSNQQCFREVNKHFNTAGFFAQKYQYNMQCGAPAVSTMCSQNLPGHMACEADYNKHLTTKRCVRK